MQNGLPRAPQWREVLKSFFKIFKRLHLEEYSVSSRVREVTDHIVMPEGERLLVDHLTSRTEEETSKEGNWKIPITV